MPDQPSKPRLHNLALAQRASHAVREFGDLCDRRRHYAPHFARYVADELLQEALNALTPADLAHMAAHSRPVAEVSP